MGIACYKGREHRAEVVKTKEGLRYKLKDGREFKSPSAAGVAVKGDAPPAPKLLSSASETLPVIVVLNRLTSAVTPTWLTPPPFVSALLPLIVLSIMVSVLLKL